CASIAGTGGYSTPRCVSRTTVFETASDNGVPRLKDRMIKVQTTLVAGPRNQRYLHPRSVGAGVPIFTVIIALEFKRSLLVVAQRQESIVQVRTVILIALLAIIRKVIILDLASPEALQLFALAAAILALGAVYWLVRDQDRSIEHDQ